MVALCARCGRTNGADARYCYYDGQPIGQGGTGPVDLATQAFPSPFVFASGASCRNFDELALGCQQNWDAAVEALRQGMFEKFLGGLGRVDLAYAAREAAAFPDPQRGLDQLLAKVPARALAQPKLNVDSQEVKVGPLPVGQDHRLEILVRNEGLRLLYGSVVSNCKWLSPTDQPGSNQKLIKLTTAATIPVLVKGDQLRAGGKPMEGELHIDSNGGSAVVKIVVQVQAQPFPEGLLAGAITPRQVAEKAMKNPKGAAGYFESGAVARWYQANGWTYPVQGPASSGLGAVQQYFEALGLTKPPKVEVSEARLKLRGPAGGSVQHQLVISTKEKRPVYAHAHADHGWLRVGPVKLQGTTAIIPLEVPQIVGRLGDGLSTILHVVANGNQRFDIPVALLVEKGDPNAVAIPIPVVPLAAVSAATIPMVVDPIPVEAKVLPAQVLPVNVLPATILPLTGATEPSAAYPGPSGQRKSGLGKKRELVEAEGQQKQLSPYMHLLPAVLLLLTLLGITLADVISDRKAPTLVAVKDEEEKKVPVNVKLPEFKAQVQDEPEEFTKDFKPGAAFVKIEDEPEERTGAAPKAGPVKVEIKDEPEEGVAMGPGGQAGIDPNHRVKFIMHASLGKWGVITTNEAGEARNKRLTFSPDGGTSSTKVRVEGKEYFLGQGGYWKGGKGGPPFGMPPPKGKIPRPGMGAGNEMTSFDDTFVVGGAGPGGKGGVHFRQVLEVVPGQQPVMIGGQPRRLLDTVLARYTLHNQDPAPRRVGIRFQIDTLIGGNDGVPFTVPGLQGLVNTVADFTQPKQIPDFIQALERPSLVSPGTVAHMSLKLGQGVEPPERVSLTHWPGSSSPYDVEIRNLGGDSAVVLYWHDKALKPGEKREIGFAYGLGGVTSAEAVGKLGLTLGGSFEPGQSFTITAYVQNPVGGQTLTLELPDGLERIEGKQIEAVPPAQAQNTSVISWKAKVLRTGEFPLRVKSSTGVAQTKTISIARPEGSAGGKLRMELAGTLEPGQTFNVIGKVEEPGPDQTLTLQLPQGLELVQGVATQKVPSLLPGTKESAVQWSVKINNEGKFPVKVGSSTGITQTKTITIVRPQQGAGSFVVTLEGADFSPGKNFTVRAKVNQPLPGQKLTLKLPAGLELAGDPVEKAVPEAPGGVGQASWEVRIRDIGKHTLGVASTTGVTVKKSVSIGRPDDSAGKFTIDLIGDIKPGATFLVKALVPQPVVGQTLALDVPTELKLMEGAANQPVPQVLGPGGAAVLWRVQVQAPGRIPIRVVSSTGVARTKTITLSESTGGIFGR